MIRRTMRSTLFPYTTLFRSVIDSSRMMSPTIAVFITAKDVTFGRRDHGFLIKAPRNRSEEHTSELQSQSKLVCRFLLEKKNHQTCQTHTSLYMIILLK